MFKPLDVRLGVGVAPLLAHRIVAAAPGEGNGSTVSDS